MQYFRFLMLVGLCFIAMLGCQRQPDKWQQNRRPTFPVGGAVVFEGSPVAGATVIFRSREHALSATALTSADGRFQLGTYDPQDGAPAGDYGVIIYKTTEHQPPRPPDLHPQADSPPLVVTHHLPARYRDIRTSGFTAAVSSKKPNEFRFELSKGK